MLPELVISRTGFGDAEVPFERDYSESCQPPELTQVWRRVRQELRIRHLHATLEKCCGR